MNLIHHIASLNVGVLTHLCAPVSLQMYVFDQENFQGRMIEISNECMNVCEMGMDRVRSLRIECGP